MNSLTPPVPRVRDRRRSLHNRLSDWRALLDECRKKPTRKSVHALRVATLRTLAELEQGLGGISKTSRQEFCRQAKKLRRVLGPVRELDVWIIKLQSLRESLVVTPKHVLPSTNECVRQIERLENRLKDKHRASEEKLVSEIERRRAHFLAAAHGIDTAILKGASTGKCAASNQILEQFAKVASDFPRLGSGNLHDFRKRVKTVRYLAEISEEFDSACKQIARKMHKMQSAIGEWHDWQALARKVARSHGRSSNVAELLDAHESESLETAISTCRQVCASLLEQPMSANGESPSSKRNPQTVCGLSGFQSSHRKVA